MEVHTVNQRIFLAINRYVGHSLWLDHLVFVAAQYLLYPLMALYFFWLSRATPPDVFEWRVLLWILALLIAFMVSYSVALVWRHKRPIRELPETKLLFHTLGTWKSFPSDHSIAAAVPFALGASLGAPAYLLAILGGGCMLIGVARVYAGVHYPRDIVGGWAIGSLAVATINLFLL